MDKFTEFEAIIKECDEIRIQDFLKTIFQGKFGGSKQRTSVDGLYILGSVELKTAEDRPMPILCCAKQMDGTLTERSSRRKQFDESVKVLKENFVHPYMGGGAVQGAFTQGLFFFFDMDGNFRLSLVTSEIVNGKQELKNYRRQSFFVSAGARNNTFRTRICKKIGSYEDLKNAFDVEKLSDEFFREYKVFYEDIVQYVTGARYIEVKKNKYERTEMSAPNHDIFDQFVNAYGNDAEKAVRNYVKKLMGRLVFIQFLQKKGWLGIPMGTDGWTGGDKDFLQHLFDNVSPEEQNSFVDKVLEEVLFYSFNRKESERKLKNSTLKKFKFPFLNCGLFDKDRDDDFDFALPGEVFHNKKFHETERKAPDIKNWTKKRKPYFNDEVCGLFDFFDRFNFTIDENDPTDADVSVDPEMLGKIFENLLEDNKDKGAFYTPKEIVGYMCNESLIAYLESECPSLCHPERNASEVEGSRIRSLVVDLNADSFNEKERETLDQKLSEVKICDPAIGSGAFPMGLLNLLYKTRLKLGVVQKKSKNPEATLKREIIQQNIYGVDIEKGAVDIAQLRFWLSLVVDEVEPDALPNLEYKIMQGNSLLESFEGIDLSTLAGEGKNRSRGKASDQMSLVFDEKQAMEQIQKDLNSFYKTDDYNVKEHLKKDINLNVKNYIKHIAPEKSKAIDELPLPNDKFFLWHTYFRDVFDRKGKNGFDIVIGNPPWGADLSKDQKLILKEEFEDIDSSTPNSYAFFIGLAYDICKGVITYVLPDSILIKDYSKTRQLIHKDLKEVIWYQNCSVPFDKRPFKHVEHDVCTLLMNRIEAPRVRLGKYVYVNGKMQFSENIQTPQQVFKPEFEYSINLIASSADLKILEKINCFRPMSEFMECHEGIHTGNIRDKLFKDSYKDGLKPLYYGGGAGDRISSYYSERSIWYVDYRPSVINKAKGEYASLRDERIFNRPKIYITRTGNPFKAFYDRDSYASNNFFSLQMICESENTESDLSFIVPFINSKICQYFIRTFAAPRLGNTFVETKIFHLLKFPIAEASVAQRKQLLSLTNAIVNLKKKNIDSDCSTQENEINKLIYELYGLTDEEIAIVEGREVASSTSSRKEVKTAATKDKVATSDDWLSGEEL